MADDNETQEPKAATIEEIEAAAPDCSADFAMKQLKAKATVEQVKDAHAAHLADELKASKEENEKLRKDAEAKNTGGGKGAKAVQTEVGKSGSVDDDVDDGDPVAAWNAAVDAEVKRTNKPRHKAAAAVAKRSPELQSAYVAHFNQ